MRRYTKQQKEKAAEVLRRLSERYPDAECALHHETPWQLLTATILSAQCTDVRVNMVTPSLFGRYPDPESMASAVPQELEDIVKSTGFFRQKARSLMEMSQDIMSRFGGNVPESLEELVTLRGVGRKTANVVIGVCFGGDGVVVDTHVRRISNRLGWTRNQDPVKIEQDLMALHPRNSWTPLAHILIHHGRDLCEARKPRCSECPVLEYCPEGIRRTTQTRDTMRARGPSARSRRAQKNAVP